MVNARAIAAGAGVAEAVAVAVTRGEIPGVRSGNLNG
jgi:hypothetical protein